MQCRTLKTSGTIARTRCIAIGRSLQKAWFCATIVCGSVFGVGVDLRSHPDSADCKFAVTLVIADRRGLVWAVW